MEYLPIPGSMSFALAYLTAPHSGTLSNVNGGAIQGGRDVSLNKPVFNRVMLVTESLRNRADVGDRIIILRIIIITIFFSVPEKVEMHRSGPKSVVDVAELLRKNDSWWRERGEVKKIETSHLKRSGLMPRK